MPIIEEQIVIDAPASRVFEFAMAPENNTLWQTNLTDIERTTPDILGKGERRRGETRVAGRTVEWQTEITEYHENEHVHMRSIDAPMPFELDWRFEDLDDSTRFTFRQEVGEMAGFFGKLGDALVTRMYSRDVRSNLEKLKELLEE